MLDIVDLVKKINSIAAEMLKSLESYELKTAPSISPRDLYSVPHNAHAALEQISPLIFEYSNSRMSDQEMEVFCKNAYGDLLTPTPEAIEQRVSKFGDDNRRDELGNIYSFRYKVYDAPDSGSIIVCPEGGEDLLTEFCSTLANPPSIVTVNKNSENTEVSVKIDVLDVTLSNEVKIKVTDQNHPMNIECNKLLMFLIILSRGGLKWATPGRVKTGHYFN